MDKTPIEKIHFHLHMYIFLAGADREKEMIEHFNKESTCRGMFVKAPI